jgi:hypothetical protein
VRQDLPSRVSSHFAALEAGKHVLTEKPIATHLVHCRRTLLGRRQKPSADGLTGLSTTMLSTLRSPRIAPLSYRRRLDGECSALPKDALPSRSRNENAAAKATPAVTLITAG